MNRKMKGHTNALLKIQPNEETESQGKAAWLRRAAPRWTDGNRLRVRTHDTCPYHNHKTCEIAKVNFKNILQ